MKVAKLSKEQVRAIAEQKQVDLNANDIGIVSIGCRLRADEWSGPWPSLPWGSRRVNQIAERHAQADRAPGGSR